jgi:N-acetylglutamate synthase-like GNAT family acetyltransferase
MGNIAAAYYALPDLHFYSGGTAPGTFASGTAATLKSIGVDVEPSGEEAPRGIEGEANPIYRVRWGTGLETMEFSKLYYDSHNPQRGFAALMVCSQAATECPMVKGAAARISAPYIDPKEYDGTELERAKYAELRDNIGRLMLSIVSQVKSREAMISRAESSDLGEILALLNSVDLPDDGVADHLAGFLIAREKSGRLVGCIGIEHYGELGLLRSAAVTPEFQRSGLGTRLTEAILHRAAQQGLGELLLLTTTARDFFEKKFGFAVTSRDDYNERLAGSPEWELPRCTSAVLMRVAIHPRR